MEMKSVVTDSPGDSAFIRGTFLVFIIHEYEVDKYFL